MGTQRLRPASHYPNPGRGSPSQFWLRSMTRLCAGVCEGLTCDGYKLPIVTCRVQCQLQYTIGATIADFAVGSRSSEGVKRFATRTDDELAETFLQVQIAVGVLRVKRS